MKKRKHTLIALMSILSFVFAMSIQSCGKRDARKNIEGTWTITSVKENGIDNYAAQVITYTGTLVFGSCSNSDNRKGNCTVNSTFTQTYMGQTETEYSTGYFRVLEKGERIQLDGEEMTLNFDNDRLIMTTTNASPEIELIVTK
ncbi:MAG: hypothetical protein NWR50_03395 [Crocinitomicaceae bacterium]|nr:hypothetical protein [Crocinitomicaceae bacterium]